MGASIKIDLYIDIAQTTNKTGNQQNHSQKAKEEMVYFFFFSLLVHLNVFLLSDLSLYFLLQVLKKGLNCL
jgi:hypothetical protein